ncbi:alpha/beta fold hydrolase [Streptomyces albiflaviniger]|nr:alpha/beta fold hydrolase [Streptomyces albiflaviniger]
MTEFVLVAGAWLGSWAWDEVVPELRAAGHGAHALTLSGLAEKRGVPAGQQTHVQDIVSEIERLDPRDVVLVGHSYAGIPVGQAAERIGDRLAHVVFVDSNVPVDGESFRGGAHRGAGRAVRGRCHAASGRHTVRACRAGAPARRASGHVHQVSARRRRADGRCGRAAEERALAAGRDGHRPLADVLPAT